MPFTLDRKPSGLGQRIPICLLVAADDEHLTIQLQPLGGNGQAGDAAEQAF
jgi:hypothetical protein